MILAGEPGDPAMTIFGGCSVRGDKFGPPRQILSVTITAGDAANAAGQLTKAPTSPDLRRS